MASKLTQKAKEHGTPPQEIRNFLQKYNVEQKAIADLRDEVARYKAVLTLLRSHPELQPEYADPLRRSIREKMAAFEEPPFLESEVKPANTNRNTTADPWIQKTQAAVNAANARALQIHALPPLTIYANQRTNIRNIPRNAVDAITGSPISNTRPALNFEGEYAAGRYYQNSAPAVLESRKHPRTDQPLAAAHWYTPKKKGILRSVLGMQGGERKTRRRQRRSTRKSRCV